MTRTQIGCATIFWIAILLVGGLIVIGQCAGPDSPSQVASTPADPATQHFPPVRYSGEGPPGWHQQADTALQALLKSCPTLHGALESSPEVELSWSTTTRQGFQRLYGWRDMIIVEADLSDAVMQTAPDWFRDPQWGNHVLIRLGSGNKPGANLDWPTDLWLCEMDDQLGQAFQDGQTRSWPQRNVLKPIPALAGLIHR